MSRVTLPALFVFFCCSCSQEQPQHAPARTGPWHVSLDLGEVQLPFTFDLEQRDNGALRIHVRNGDETIVVDDIDRNGDSLVVRMPLYDSEFKGRTAGDGTLTGHWYNYLRGNDHRIPFTARAGEYPRFPDNRPAAVDLSGTWEVHFAPGTEDTYPAIGIIEQDKDGRATGTFITETGDYRYLEGSVSGDSIRLSCFDGSHAFLFAAALDGDSLLGRFWSGVHWQTTWVGVRNPEFTLRHPDSLTYLREGHDMVDFRFPDLDGEMVSPSDARFNGRTLLVQIMGSWCPNCVDETRLLNELYSAHHQDGLEVISVAFERQEDTLRALDGLRRFRDVLDVRYPILYAGRSGKGEASKKLPFLNHVMSYPTCIIIDHTGKVRRIRTGIYGPSTGTHYERYKHSLELFLVDLLDEARDRQFASDR